MTGIATDRVILRHVTARNSNGPVSRKRMHPSDCGWIAYPARQKQGKTGKNWTGMGVQGPALYIDTPEKIMLKI